MRDSRAGTDLRSEFRKSIASSLLVYNLTEETGQQGLTFLLESTVDAGTSLALAAPTCWMDESKLMVTTLMRPVKEIIS